MTYAEQLLSEIVRSKHWPLTREQSILKLLRNYIAIYESDAVYLTPHWWYEDEANTRLDYVIDPLGERIPSVWAEMLFGEEPVISAAAKGDKDRMESFIEFNKLPSELKRAEEIRSSEGEVWWRNVAMPSFGHVQTEWHSRTNVIPLLRGPNVVACAFVSVLEVEGQESGGDRSEWVYVEVHGEKVILNRLFYHKVGQPLGNPVELSSRPETEDLNPEIHHGLPMQAGRMMNKRGRKWVIGISDYKGIDGLLLHLSELQNIGQGNARLTGKQRVVIPQRFLNQLGQLPKGAEVVVATEVDADPDKIKNEFAQIEWKFDATNLVLWKNDVVDTILTRARVAPPLVGRSVESAQTGPALRARLLDSVLAAQGKGQTWDDDFPIILERAIQFEKLAEALGGCGISWVKTGPPSFKRKNSLPEDEEGRTRRVVMEVNAEILSQETAIEENNPDWTPERVQEELRRLKDERESEPQPPVIDAGGGNPLVDPATQGVSRKPGERVQPSTPEPKRPVRA